MSIHFAKNSPIPLADNKGLTLNEAQNIQKALSPFGENQKVPKSISKLETIQPRSISAINTSSAKAFFSSLAQAIRDVCHNIVAFCSQSDETILNIAIPADNIVQQLRANCEKIKIALQGNNSKYKQILQDGKNDIQKAITNLQNQLNNGNEHNFNLAGDGRKALIETLAILYEARLLLSYSIGDELKNALNDIKNLMQGLKSDVQNDIKDLKAFQNETKNRIEQEMQSFQEVCKDLKDDAKSFFNGVRGWFSDLLSQK